ncbi:eukaryotic translation initation factor 4 gamma, putative [Plasmodium malariae]|uniref:Eukaryotic translation initation factor 4 gamma, putative n=1 Tax=Plasmodium malariae TaxID=5858 RepID=A0A1A8WGA8_PLAMA|nr:eukaryotic translation initation factor 4 gamma, putative [Plasmodium malariae]
MNRDSAQSSHNSVSLINTNNNNSNINNDCINNNSINSNIINSNIINSNIINNNSNNNSNNNNSNNNEEEDDNDDWGELGEDKYIDINSIIKKKNVILNQLEADLSSLPKKGQDNKNKKKIKSKKERDNLHSLLLEVNAIPQGDKKKNKKNKNKNTKSSKKENEPNGKEASNYSNSNILLNQKKGGISSFEPDSKLTEQKTNTYSEIDIRTNEENNLAEEKTNETGTDNNINNNRNSSSNNKVRKADDCKNEALQINEKKEQGEKPAKAIYVFKKKENMSPLEYMERQIKSLLNKLTVENFPIITEKLCQIMDSRVNTDEIQTVVNQVINKAVLEHDWSEMYADVCQALKWRSPNFEMKKKTSFEIALLKKIQEEYENLPSTFESTMKEKLKNDENEEELSFVEQKQKKRLFGIVKLIGELFQRQIVSISIVISIAHDLLIAYEDPKEYCIEAFLQLIYSTGFFIDKMEKYRNILDTWFGRLKELQRKKMYSKRIKFVIQDVFDLRLSEWRKKTHKDTAKGLNELRSQLETEEMMGGSIHLAQLGNIVIVGERHNIRNNESYSKYMQEQERLSKANQKK